MAFEFIDAPLVGTLELSEDRMLRTCDKLIYQIGQISGNPPVYLDISTQDKLATLVNDANDSLYSLIRSGLFHLVDSETPRMLEKLVHSDLVASQYDREIGLIHTDLNKGNIFVCPDGYRVLDWQRPMRGPKAIDKVDFLRSFGIDASTHVGPGAVVIWLLLTIWWCTQCQTRWIMEGTIYEKWIANFASEIKKLS